MKWLKKFFVKKKHPLDILTEQGHYLIWGTCDDKGNDTCLKHGCGIIDHHGNLIDVTGQSDVRDL